MNKQSRRILRRKEVRKRTTLSDTTIWRREKNKTFPLHFLLNEYGNAVGWWEDEIDDWVASHIRGFGRAVPRKAAQTQRQGEVTTTNPTSTEAG